MTRASCAPRRLKYRLCRIATISLHFLFAFAFFNGGQFASSQVATPVISPSGGVFVTPLQITITDSTPGTAIYYTKGAAPSISSTLYTGPFPISATETIKAIAVEDGYSNSPVASSTYTIPTTDSWLTLDGVDPYNFTCRVAGVGYNRIPGPTGLVTFRDVTTGQTLATSSLGRVQAAQITKKVEMPVGAQPIGLVASDFNGDGYVDLASTNAAGPSFSILLGDGDGNFEPAITLSVQGGPMGIATGDFNGDGIPDIVTANDGDQSVSVVLGNGDGTFQPQQVFAVGGEPTIPVVADFNRDGVQDIAVTTDSNVAVLLGNGDGTFQPAVNYPVGSRAIALVAGDFSRNNKIDLITANNDDNTLSVLIGNGDGTFQSQQVLANQVGSGPIALSAADFNGDGRLDIAVASFGSQTVTVLLGNGDGTFQFSPELITLMPSQIVGIAAGDLNGDGILDLAVTDGKLPRIFQLNGNGDGTFSLDSSVIQVGAGLPGSDVLRPIVFGEFAGPGTLGLATPNFGSNTVTGIHFEMEGTASARIEGLNLNPGNFASHSFQCNYSGDGNYLPGDSNTVIRNYPQVALPIFSLLVGNYPSARSVSIFDASRGAAIHYTMDGSTPTPSSPMYEGPIDVSSSVTLKAIATLPAYEQSPVSEAVYTIADAPQFSAVAAKAGGASKPGTEASTVAETVTITDKTPGAVIYYSTDGSAPSTKSMQYKGPFSLFKATTVRAFAVAPGRIDSRESAQTYAIQLSRPEITWAALAPIVYGTALGARELNATSDVKGTFTYSPKKGTVLDAGVQWIKVTFTPSNPDVFAAVTKTVEIEVKRATITVAASHISVGFGKPIPPLSYTLAGFVNGENRNRLSGRPVETTTAKQGSPAGTYPIMIKLGTLAAQNYKFALKDAKLTITP